MNKDLIYNILLVKYMRQQKINDVITIFPEDYFYGNIDAKIDILVDAINNNIKVSDTEKYSNYVEKVGYIDEKNYNIT